MSVKPKKVGVYLDPDLRKKMLSVLDFQETVTDFVRTAVLSEYQKRLANGIVPREINEERELRRGPRPKP